MTTPIEEKKTFLNAKVLAEAAQKQRHELMYRGVKVERKFASKS